MSTNTNAGRGQTVEELAKSLNLTVTYTKDIEDMLYHDMLISLYRREPLEFEQQKMLEASTKKVAEYEKELPKIEKLAEASDKELKELQKKRARLSASLGRSISQIKEDLVSLGFLAENAAPEIVREAVAKEQERMLDIAEEVAEYDFDIDVLKKQNTKLHEQVTSLKDSLEYEKEAIDYWVDLQSYNASMNKKVADAYKELTGVTFNKNSVSPPNPMFLQGIPGQGKTAVYSSAARRVCKKLQLNFIKNLGENYQPQRNDFVMVVQECAGETSGLLFAGLPKSEEIEVHKQKRFVLTKAFNKRFMSFETAAGGCLLFDDASNATMNIQNMLLPVVQNKSFAGMLMVNCLIGATGNLGSIDHTHIHAMSTALKTRVNSRVVADHVEDFRERMAVKFNDEYGTCGIDAFLQQFTDFFSRTPGVERTPVATGFACSRTYEDLITILRNDFQRFGGRGKGEERLIEVLQDHTTAKLGLEVGEKVTTFLRSYFSGTNQLALNFINAETAEQVEAAKKEYDEFTKKNGGAGINSLTNSYEFTSSLVDHTMSVFVKKYTSEDPKERKEALTYATTKFANAVMLFPSNFLSTAMTMFQNRLAHMDTEYTATNQSGIKVLTPSACLEISTICSQANGFTKAKKEVISATLSGYANMTNNVDVAPTKVSSRSSLID